MSVSLTIRCDVCCIPGITLFNTTPKELRSWVVRQNNWMSNPYRDTTRDYCAGCWDRLFEGKKTKKLRRAK